MEKLGIEPAASGLQGIALIHYTFVVAFLGINQFRQVGLIFVLVFIIGTPKDSPKVVFKEKPGIEPATTGLQGIALIHYTFCGFPVYKPVPPGWFKICVLVLCREHPKAHRKWF